eukprot:6191088-Pleurochrysis_carterae.AAC.5
MGSHASRGTLHYASQIPNQLSVSRHASSVSSSLQLYPLPHQRARACAFALATQALPPELRRELREYFHQVRTVVSATRVLPGEVDPSTVGSH